MAGIPPATGRRYGPPPNPAVNYGAEMATAVALAQVDVQNLVPLQPMFAGQTLSVIAHILRGFYIILQNSQSPAQPNGTINSIYQRCFTTVRLRYNIHGRLQWATIPAHNFQRVLTWCFRNYPAAGMPPFTGPNVNRLDWQGMGNALINVIGPILNRFHRPVEQGGSDVDWHLMDAVQVEVHVVPEAPGALGSCSLTGKRVTFVHRFVIEGDDNDADVKDSDYADTVPGPLESAVHLVSVRSKDHNCGIQAMLHGFDSLHYTIRARCEYLTGTDRDTFKRPRSMTALVIRRAARLPEGPIHYRTGMDAITALTGVQITIVDLHMRTLHQTTLSPGVPDTSCHVVLCLDSDGVYDKNSGQGHYFLVKSGEYRVRDNELNHRRNVKSVLCPLCHDFKRLSHKCDKSRAKAVERLRPSEEDQETARARLRRIESSSSSSSSSSDDGYRESPTSVQLQEVKEYFNSMVESVFDHGLHILVHGPGGSGKSHLISALLDESVNRRWSSNEFVKVSPTGVVAVANGGTTLHAWLGLSGNVSDATANSVLFHRVINNREAVKRVARCRVLLFDEIGMLSSKMLQLLEAVARYTRKNSDPMGGLILILMGDVLQLPTIRATPFWRSPAWSRIVPDLRIFNRTETFGFRYKELVWSQVLSNVRTGSVSEADDLFLKTRNFRTVSEAITRITEDFGESLTPWRSITSLNRTRRTLTKACLSHIPSSEKKTFTARDSCSGPVRLSRGSIPNRIAKRLPAGIDKEFTVVKGWPVMYVGNNALRSSLQVANGSTGHILSWSDDSVSVHWDNGEKCAVVRDDFSFTVGGGGTFTRSQFPLALAVSGTVHKVQGMTIDGPLLLVLNGTFEMSQVYVALSRCRSFKHVYIVGYSKLLIKVSPAALAFNKWCLSRDHLNRSNSDPLQHPSSVFGWNTYSPDEDADLSLDPLYNCDDHHQLTCRMIPGRHATTVEASKLARKTIWYDLETYFNGDREEPYYNYMIELWTNANGETISENTKEICSLCHVDTPQHVPPDKIMEETVKWIMERVIRERDNYLSALHSAVPQAHIRRLKPPYYLCAYNGAGFDFHFLMRELLNSLDTMTDMERFIVQPVMKGGYIAMMSVFDMESDSEALVVHDICQFTKCSLSKAAQEYLDDDTLSKGTFPHSWVTENFDTFMRAGNDPVSLTLEDFPLGCHREVAREMMAKGELNLSAYPIHSMLHQYGQQDVKVLKALYECVDKLSLEQLGASILNFHTISQYTWYGCVKNFPEDMTIRVLPEGTYGLTQELKDKETSRKFDIYRLTRDLDKETKTVVIGGKVLPRCHRWRSPDADLQYDEIKDFYIYADIVSMYPWAMINCDYPVGKWSRHTSPVECEEFKMRWLTDWSASEAGGPLEDEKFPLLLAKVDITLNDLDLEPPVARPKILARPEQGLAWDVGFRHTRWLTSLDLWLVTSSGGTLHKVVEYITFERRGRPYAPWVQTCFNGKREAQLAGQSAKRQQCKLAANGAYGTTLKRDFDDVVVAVSNVKQLNQFHSDFDWLDTVNWRELLECRRGTTPKTLLLKGERHRNTDYDVTSKPRYHGAFTLSWTRVLLDAMMRDVNPSSLEGTAESVAMQPLYGDTDSFMFHSSALPRMLRWFGSECGQLSDDLADPRAGCDWKRGKFVKVVDFASRCPKWYACRGICPDGSRKDVVKMASINVKGAEFTFPDGHTQNSLSFDDFMFICDHHSSPSAEKITVTMNDRLLRCGVKVPVGRRVYGNRSYDLYRGSLSRTVFKTHWDARQELVADSRGTIWTVPHGWSGQLPDIVQISEEEKEEEEKEGDEESS